MTNQKKKKNLNSRQILGREGERRAAAFLLARRYKILRQNWRIAGGEIDILAQDQDGTLIVVEVKTRTESGFANPQDNVDFKKVQTLTRLARAVSTKNPERNVQIDVIEVTGDKINHIQNITV